MKLSAQALFFCALFTFQVWLQVRRGALNGLFFYPRPVREEAFAKGLSTPEKLKMQRLCFLIPFVAVQGAVLFLLVYACEASQSFRSAYLHSLFLLEVMNLYDGIVIDKLWVGLDPFWKLPGIDSPYAQSWPEMFIKRAKLALFWVFAALLPALPALF